MTKNRPGWSRGSAGPPPPAGDSDEFARLLAETGRERFASLAAGDRVEGTVVQRTASALLVDVGQRSEAVMPLEGMTPEELVAFRNGGILPYVLRRLLRGK
jgi:ribosomal protein S1